MAVANAGLNSVGRKLPASITMTPIIATTKDTMPQPTSKPNIIPPTNPNKASRRLFT